MFYINGNSTWYLPGTCPDDPDYERSYLLASYLRKLAIQFWLASGGK